MSEQNDHVAKGPTARVSRSLAIGAVLICLAIFMAAFFFIDPEHTLTSALIAAAVLALVGWPLTVIGLGGRGWIVRYLSAIIGVPLILAVPALIWGTSSSRDPRHATAGSPQPQPPGPPDPKETAIRLVRMELEAQKRGGVCGECWVAEPEGHAMFKNLLEYEVEGTFRCKGRDGSARGSLVGVEVKARAQNSFGAVAWEHYEAAVVKDGGSWKLVYFGEIEEAGGKPIDFCMVAGIAKLFDRYP